MIKRFAIGLLFTVASLSAWGAQPALLPAEFNGWHLDKQTLKAGSNASAIDPTDSAVLKEYGFADFAIASYAREGRTLQIKAVRFADASGAYGAFSYYVQPQMHVEKIGDRAASNNARVLFYRGNILIDAQLDRVTAMSASDLRALADALPRPHGNLSVLPTLPLHLPRTSIPNSDRYVMGPVALERLGSPIPAALVNFDLGPEVELAKYRATMGAEINFTLIEYPTYQMAAERIKALQAAALPAGPFYFRRSGPLLAVVSGPVEESEARLLLDSVVYDANVTWNQATRPNPRDNLGNVIVTIFTLIGLILAVALILGIAFGGIRVLAKKYFPDRFFDRPEDVEIIQLHLK